jgi:hypothetical protein
MTPEGKVKAKAKRILDALGAYYFMPATGGFGRNGVPDIVGCLNGVFFAIECKANGGRPTALQLREINRINAAKGLAIVVDEDSVSLLESLPAKLGQRHL